jgi:hypothetical protein
LKYSTTLAGASSGLSAPLTGSAPRSTVWSSNRALWMRVSVSVPPGPAAGRTVTLLVDFVTIHALRGPGYTTVLLPSPPSMLQSGSASARAMRSLPANVRMRLLPLRVAIERSRRKSVVKLMPKGTLMNAQR